jgi:hypothetical protein
MRWFCFNKDCKSLSVLVDDFKSTANNPNNAYTKSLDMERALSYYDVIYEIEYIKETEIGKLARNINQCYGQSRDSIYRNKKLILKMLEYCRTYNFKRIK